MAGGVAVATLLHSPAFLEQATTTEQYTLLTALLVALLVVADFMFRAPEKPWLNAMFGVLFGLAMGNHPSQMVLILLAAAVLLGRPRAGFRDRIMDATWCGAGTVAGLLIYLWVPLRSRTAPLLDFARIDSVERWWGFMTRQNWSTRPLTEAPPGLVPEWFGTYDWLGQLGILGCILTVVGMWVLAAKDRPRAAGVALVAIPYAGGMLVSHMKQSNIDVSYIRQYGVTDWHLPLYLVGALCGGVATGWVMQRFRPWGLRVGILVALGAGVTGWQSIAQHSLRDFSAPRTFIDALLAPLPDACILLPRSDNVALMLGYETLVSDVSAGRYIALDDHVINAAIARALQSGEGWGQPDRLRYLSETAFEPSRQAFHGPVPSEEDLRTLSVFTEYVPAEPAAARRLLPAGMLFQLTDEPVGPDEVLAAEAAWRGRAPRALALPPGGAHRWEREAWALLHQWRGAYFVEHGLLEQAGEAYRQSLECIESNGAIWYCLAAVHEGLGLNDAAFTAYVNAIQWSPALVGPRSNLAILLAQAGRFAEAEPLLVEELGLNPGDKIVTANLEQVRRDRRKK